MDFDQLRASLRKKQVSATYDADTGDLHMDLPEGVDLTPEERTAIKQFKPQIAALAGGGQGQVSMQDVRRASMEDPRRIGAPLSPEEEGLRGTSQMEQAMIGLGGGLARGGQGIRQALGGMSPEDRKKWAENFRTLSRAGQISKPVTVGQIAGEILPAAVAGSALAAPIVGGLSGSSALASMVGAPTAATALGAGSALARMAIPGAVFGATQFQAPGEEESRLKGAAKGAAFTTAAELGLGAVAKGGMAAFDALANLAAKVRTLAKLGEEFSTHIPPAELALSPRGQAIVENTTRRIFPGTSRRMATEAEAAMKGLPERIAPGPSGEKVDELFDRIRQLESRIAEKAPAASGDLPRLTSIKPTAQMETIGAEPELFRSAAARSEDVANRLKYLERPEAPTGLESGVTTGGPEMFHGRDISRQAEDFAKWRSQRGILTSAQRLASRQGDDTTVKALGKLIGAGDKDAQAYIESLAAHGEDIGGLGGEMQAAYTAGRAGVRAGKQRDAITDILTKASGPLPGSDEPVLSLAKAATALSKESLQGMGYTPGQRQILFGAARLAKLASKGQMQALNPPTGNRLFFLLAGGAAASHPVAAGVGVGLAGAGRIAFDSPAVSRTLIWLARLPENQLVGASSIAVSKALDRVLIPAMKKIGEAGIRPGAAGMVYQAKQRQSKEAQP